MANGKVESLAACYYVGGQWVYVLPTGDLSSKGNGRQGKHIDYAVPVTDAARIVRAVLDSRPGSVELWPAVRASADRTGGAVVPGAGKVPALPTPESCPDAATVVGAITPVETVAAAYYPQGGDGAFCYVGPDGRPSGIYWTGPPEVVLAAAVRLLDSHNGCVEVWPASRVATPSATPTAAADNDHRQTVETGTRRKRS